MKKIIALLLACLMVFAFAACGNEPAVDPDPTPEVTPDPTPDATPDETPDETPDANVDEVVVMTHDEFIAAEMDSEVVIETYVQGKQSWWDNKGTFYTQDENGGYFLYEMPCTEDEYNQLTVGTKIRVTGYKTVWEGEVEIIDSTFEILEGNYVAEPVDVTDLLGTDELIDHQNELAIFKGLTVEKVEYKNDEPGDDIYVTVSKDGESYDFCVEVYLTGTDTDVYKAVGELAAGDVIDVTGFVYWYQGVNTHITAISK